MKNTIFNLSLVFALSQFNACLAADTTAKPSDDLGKNASNTLNTFGKSASQAVQSIEASVKNLGKDDHQSGKVNQKSDKDSNQSNDWRRDASNAMNTLERDANGVGKAISNKIKDSEQHKEIADRKETPKTESESSLSQSFNDVCQNASKFGESIVNFIGNMCKQAGEQIDKAQHAFESFNSKPASQDNSAVNKQNK